MISFPRLRRSRHGARRHADPFAGSALLSAPVASDPVTDWGPGFDAVYDAATASLEAACETAPVPEMPHGIAAPEVLVALIARAAAQAPPFTGASAVGQMTPPSRGADPAPPAPPWGSWDRPGTPPLMDEDPRWYGPAGITMPDNRAPMSRPYLPEPEHWHAPLSADESRDRVRRVTYPPAVVATRDRYAAVMCQVSAATGTRSPYEHPAMWGAARPGTRREAVITWSWQREPLLAIEAAGAVAA